MIFILSCDNSISNDGSSNNSDDEEQTDGTYLECEESCCSGCNCECEPSIDSCEYDYCQEDDICLSLENLDENEQFFEIRITSNKYTKGFQFNFNNEDITIIGFSGGITQESGWSPSSSDNTIIAFSFSGNPIPPVDNGLLGNVYYSDHMLEEMNSLQATFSDCVGNSLNVNYSISF